MTLEIHDYIQPGRTAHLVGIGGVSMSPLAEVLHGAGVRITGSDAHESGAVEHLRALGVPVTIGHLPESVEGADCVIRTAAIHDDNPEIAAARAAVVGGFKGTANLLAAQMYGLKAIGTAAHCFTLVHDDEKSAFESQIAALGKNTTLLVDTYNIEEAVKTAAFFQ